MPERADATLSAMTIVGGRLSLLGAVYGTLLVNWAKTTFSETMPELWLLAVIMMISQMLFWVTYSISAFLQVNFTLGPHPAHAY